MLLLTTN